uniref:Exocyst complex component 8-like n=1 Tax=Phallusia mammillata TaxID=59560 RepID=A0A6F9DCT7_9ASCI|nr:exocyst complex component 8-like [Phallusia mammillata]
MADPPKAATKASTSLAKNLSSRNFDPEKFANSISAHSDGDKDLQENRARVQALGEETAQILKKQVYHNYQLFIDTAKEISYLEGEMFQLNHILTEQKNLMEVMTTIFTTKGQTESSHEDDNKKKLADKEHEQRKVMSALVGKIEGSNNILEMPGRYLVHDGDVVELDTDSFNPIGKIHMFLFNDCVMVTTWASTRRGNAVAGKYKFQLVWEIDTLAMVNARDVGRKKIPARTVKNAFKVLIFPDSRMFQCESAKEKREWLEIVDATKRKHLSEKEKKKELMSATSPNPLSPSRTTNPFTEFETELTEAVNIDSHSQATPEKVAVLHDERLSADWLHEMPEDLDVFIAQRNFEQAVNLILESKTYLSNISDCPLKTDFEQKLINRRQQLVEVLSRELRSSPDRSLRGGPRVIRRPVVLLIQLEESTKACHLFLNNRTSAVAFAVRQLRTEGSLPLYISKLCKVFFNNLEETAREFQLSFKETSGCYSSFVVWAQEELTSFVDTFSQQVFGRNADVTEVAECVQNAEAHCEKLHCLGLDLDFLLNNLLLPHIQAAIGDHKQKIIDATKLRNSEETWRPTNMVTPQATDKMIDEMTVLGLKSFMDYCYDSCFIRLTGSTLAFSKAILTHVDSAMKMLLPELQKPVLDGIAEVVLLYTDFTSGCLRCETERQDKAKLIRENARFLAESLLPLVEQKIQKKIRQSPKKLIEVRQSFLKEVTG